MLKNLFALTITMLLVVSCSPPLTTNTPLQQKELLAPGRTGVFAIKNEMSGGLTSNSGGLTSGGGLTPGGTPVVLTLEEQLAAALADIDALKANRADLENTRDTHRETRKAAQESRREQLTQKRELRTNALNTARSDLQARKREARTIEKGISKGTHQQAELNAKLAEIEALNALIVTLTAQIADFQTEIDALKLEIEALTAQIKAINEEIAEINSQIRLKNDEVKVIRNKIRVRDKNNRWIANHPCPNSSDKAKYEYDTATGLITGQTCTPCAERFGSIAFLPEQATATLELSGNPSTSSKTIYMWNSLNGINSAQSAYHFFNGGNHSSADSTEVVTSTVAGGIDSEFESDCRKCEGEGYTYTHIDNSPQCTDNGNGTATCTNVGANNLFPHTRFCHKPFDGDSDQDGISDSADVCASTAIGQAVDSTGCPNTEPDSDADGIADLVDACKHTPAGAVVDTTGCTGDTTDSDGDGVIDEADLCSAEAGVAGSFGCPADGTLGIIR